MFKKLFFLVFTFSLLVNSTVLAASKVPITSNMYGAQYKNSLQFDSTTCSNNYKELNISIKNAQMSDYKTTETDSGVSGKIIDIINTAAFNASQTFSDLLFKMGCNLGIAPSQLLQLMFFPIVLDNFQFLDDISTVIQTISICVLAVAITISIYEMNKREGSLGQEVISKTGRFMFAVGVIAFSKYILQGIFDIGNILGYYISNYSMNIPVDPSNSSITVPMNLLEYPTIFITYLEMAFSPSSIGTGIAGLMLTALSIIKIIVLIFMTKDLLRIATYGMKRIITLVAAPVVLPVLAGLIPSYKTSDIFNKYFRNVIAAAFTPVLFGLIYLASAPFVIERVVTIIDAPLLKVLALGFFLNILSSIPGYVDNLIGSSSTLGSPNFERGVNSTNFGTFRGMGNAADGARHAQQGIARNYSELRNRKENPLGRRAALAEGTKAYGKQKLRNFALGKDKNHK